MLDLIKKYINNLDVKTINDFLTNENIYLNSDELNHIYNIIKDNWYDILYNNNIEKYKSYVSLDNYTKLYNLYIKYYSKYKNYL